MIKSMFTVPGFTRDLVKEDLPVLEGEGEFETEVANMDQLIKLVGVRDMVMTCVGGKWKWMIKHEWSRTFNPYAR